MTLRIGDELRIPGLPEHVMTYIGRLGPLGEDVLDAPKGQSARLTFSSSLPLITRVGKRGPETWIEQQGVQRRAFQVLGTPYSLLQSNCEHISSFVRTGKMGSPQLLGAALLAGIGVLLLAVKTA
jgi:hypothetical protein